MCRSGREAWACECCHAYGPLTGTRDIGVPLGVRQALALLNLDALSTSPSTYGDPLARWGKVLNDVLVSDAPKAKVTSHLAQAKALHDAMQGRVSAIQHGMDGSRLSLEQVFSLPAMHLVATPYAMVRVFSLLTPLLETVGELGHTGFYTSPRATGPHIPLFSEFFVHFGGSKTDIRGKKRWP